MKAIRMGIALAAAVAVAVGAASAQAGHMPLGPTITVSGTLSNYVAASHGQPGSVTISVSAIAANGTYAGTIASLAVTNSTKLVGHKIHNGDTGSITIQLYDAAPIHPALAGPIAVLTDKS